MSIEKLSLTIALGISFGIMPVIGLSTIILTILAIVFRLNIPAIQLVNYLAEVIRIILFVPFIKLGQIIFYPNESGIQINNILHNYHTNFFATFKSIWHLNLGGILVWAFIAIPLGLLIYYKIQPLLKKQRLKMKTAIARV
jgi:uncharacterized protein (DUF2062 family)